MKSKTEFEQVYGITTQTEFINVAENQTEDEKSILRNLASLRN